MINNTNKEGQDRSIREIFREELRGGHSIRMNIKGKCMHPFIKKSDIITVKPVKFDETKIGDVVVYTRNFHHDFTVHRLIKYSRDKEGKKYIFSKGDANLFGDLPVYPEEVYGKAVTIEKGDGKIIDLDTQYRRLQGYLFAKRTWLLGVLRIFLKSPHLIPIKVIHKIKNFFSKK